MGNTQEKPPGGRGGGGGTRPAPTPAERRTRSQGADCLEKPQLQTANGTQRSPAGGAVEQENPAVDTSYLDAPAGALPPHLARLKNEGNQLFRHGQFGDALEKYTQAIDGCAEAGGGIQTHPSFTFTIPFFIPDRLSGFCLVQLHTRVTPVSASIMKETC